MNQSIKASISQKLSQRIGVEEVNAIVLLAQSDNSARQALYELLFDADERIGYQASWVFTHFSLQENSWLYDKQQELIRALFACQHSGKRRLLLNLIYRQPQENPPRVDLLDYCLDRMVSSDEPHAIRALSMKLAYELCISIPELLQEFSAILEMMQPELLPPSIRSARGNVLKALKSRRSLQALYEAPNEKNKIGV